MSRDIRPRRAGIPNSVLPVLLLCLLYNSGVVTGDRPVAFFAFGDSYADTGNSNKSTSSAWHVPYGETWPGHPAGRYGNGRIQTDIFAKIFRLPTPAPLAFVKSGASAAKGVNLAFGGAGVTYAYGAPTLSTQVDELDNLVANGYFVPADSSTGTKEDISGYFSKSVALVSIAGNDYGSYNGTFQALPAFVKAVVAGLELNLRRLYKLGIRKMIVENLSYLPCVPALNKAQNYTSCSNRLHAYEVLWLHNALLGEAVSQLHGELLGVDIIYVNQSKAFQHIITHPGEFGITEPLRPCCVGKTAVTACGSVDNKGLPLYTLCEEPSKHMFWDDQHPTQQSWKSITRLWLLADGYIVNGPRLKTWIKHLEF